ncbi:MAG TPA: translation elongation factor Ts [bacterium]|jgi:elongation factor Ts|nr:translation elongation factor Ts [bacterium]HOG38723.1 translation elongation factor Ts [bacterium]HQI03601.1 translation elongation factor Ts [bacterium]
MEIAQIKQLRDLTGAGMNDCKKALEETNGDLNKAIELLRKKGEQLADKKSSRTANEGCISVIKKDNKVSIFGLNCETDFVARNADFISSTKELAEKLLEVGKDSFEELANEKIKNELIVKIGENLKIAFFDIIEGDVVGYYLHTNNKIASIVSLSGGNEELAKDIAMHATAMNPKYLKSEEVPADIIEKEKEIYREQLQQEGKPENIIENIIKGKLEKFYKENCLINQLFVKDDTKTIGKLLEENQAEIVKFTRYSL